MIDTETIHVAFSIHALDRMMEMGVSREEVLGVAYDPDVTYPSPHPEYEGCFLFRGGRLAVPVSDDGMVITVLWDSPEEEITR